MKQDRTGDTHDEKMFFLTHVSAGALKSGPTTAAFQRRRVGVLIHERAALCYYNRTIIDTDARWYTCARVRNTAHRRARSFPL